MIESAACNTLQSQIVRFCGRILHLASLSFLPKSDKQLRLKKFLKHYMLLNAHCSITARTVLFHILF